MVKQVTNSNLFQYGNFVLHSGQKSKFKIECDALTFNDWDCIAYLISQQLKFNRVFGVPRGGIKLAQALQQYYDHNSLVWLIVDDVWTTGSSMNAFKKDLQVPQGIEAKGAVFLARNKVEDWVFPVLRMTGA